MGTADCPRTSGQGEGTKEQATPSPPSLAGDKENRGEREGMEVKQDKKL